MSTEFIEQTDINHNDIAMLERHLELGDFSKAKKLCIEILNSNLSSKLLASSLIKNFYIKSLDKDKALQFLLDLNEEIDSSPELKFQLADIFFMNKKNYPEAISLSVNILTDLVTRYNYPAARIKLFHVYLDQNRIDLATDELNVIKEFDDVSNLLKEELEAELHLKSYKFEKAYNKLKKICTNENASVHAYKLLAESVKFNDHENVEEVKFLEKKLQHKKLSLEDKSTAYLFLAKVYMDCNKHKEAFNFINKASKLYLKSFHYNASTELNFYKECLKLLESPEIDFNNEEEETTNRSLRENVFILSFPGALNTDFLFYLSNLLSYEYAGDNSYLSHMLPGEKNSETSIDQIKQILQMEASDLDIFREFYEENVKNDVGYLSKVVDTTALNFIYAPIIKKIFPNAKFIYIKSNKDKQIARSFISNISTKNHLANYNLKTASELYNIFTDSVKAIRDKFSDSFVEIDLEADLDENGDIKEDSLDRIADEIGTDLNLENYQSYQLAPLPVDIENLVNELI
ncbi:MAG: hypothetical protein HRT47_07965 [Candidatus Caenarcaniphilales bacterium]|nr:hypothetical protein [Candidatus Caenarcaniphilales bacterium]